MFVWSKLSASKWADAWEERFTGSPTLSLVITEVPGRKTVRVEVFSERKSSALAIQKEWGGSVRKVKNQNWAAMAPPTPDPIKVRSKLVICAARTDREVAAMIKKFPGKEVICVPADLAFGTGHHATTETMLRFLCDVSADWQKAKQAWTLCDLGCGTGILAIAGERLGAKKIWGCDFDPQAVRVSKENAERNKTERCTFVKADVLQWKPKQQYDCVAANIFYDVLTEAFPNIVAATKPGGYVMVSGILKDHSADCLIAGEKAGIGWERVVTKGKWVSALGSLRAGR